MFRMTKVTTTQTPSTTKPFLSHTSRSKTKLASLPHYVDLFDESVCESAEGNLLHLDELKSSPFSLFQSSSNPFELPKPTKTSIPNQPLEDPNKVRVVNPNPHSTICNPEPKPSFVLDTLYPQSQLTFVRHMMTHLKIWINLISVIPPAPLPI